MSIKYDDRTCKIDLMLPRKTLANLTTNTTPLIPVGIRGNRIAINVPTARGIRRRKIIPKGLIVVPH